MGEVGTASSAGAGLLARRRLTKAEGFGLLLLLVLPCFLALGEPPLWDANEPLYAEPPKEVVSWAQGDFWAPTWNGEVFYAHPPLSTWITVPFYRWLGANEAAERLPMALAAVLTVLSVFFLGCRVGGPGFGFLSGLVLAATPRYWLYARQLSGDVYMVAFLTAAFALAAPAFEGERRSGRYALASVLVAVGCLAKGPVVLVLFGTSLGVAWFFSRPRLPLTRRRVLYVLRWALLAVLLSAPWYVYMALRYPDFLGEHFGYYHFARLVGGIGDRGPFFYVVALLGDAEPWILLLPFAGWLAWKRGSRRAVDLLPWAVILVTFLAFSLSAGKRNVYMLPLYPMMAIALTPLLRSLAVRGRTRLTRGAGLLLAVVALGGAAGLWILQTRAPALRPEVWILLATLLVAGAAALLAAWRGGGRALVIVTIASLWAIEVTGALTLPALGRFRPVPTLARAITREEDPARPEPAIVYRVAILSLNFYVGRKTEVAHDPQELAAMAEGWPRVFVLTREDRIPELAGSGLEFEELARGPYLALQFRSVILGREKVTRDLVLLVGHARRQDG